MHGDMLLLNIAGETNGFVMNTLWDRTRDELSAPDEEGAGYYHPGDDHTHTNLDISGTYFFNTSKSESETNIVVDKEEALNREIHYYQTFPVQKLRHYGVSLGFYTRNALFGLEEDAEIVGSFPGEPDEFTAKGDFTFPINSTAITLGFNFVTRHFKRVREINEGGGVYGLKLYPLLRRCCNVRCSGCYYRRGDGLL